MAVVPIPSANFVAKENSFVFANFPGGFGPPVSGTIQFNTMQTPRPTGTPLVIPRPPFLLAALSVATFAMAVPALANGIYRNGAGARSMALAGTEVGLENDPISALHSNPAALRSSSTATLQLGAVGGFATGDFENSVVRNIKKRGLDGVICGHIHTPVIKRIDGMTYINCGDWVDSCTAIIEQYDGRMQLVRWTHPAEANAASAVAIAEAPVA